MGDLVAVCGAGVMGAGIAEVFAVSEHDVIVYDADPAALPTVIGRIRSDLDKAVERGRIERSQAQAALARVRTVESVDQVNGAGLVVEAVAERLEAKQELFATLDEVCPPPALIVSNTSTLSVTEIASVLGDSGRAAGLHFFNPATRMKLVEIIPGHDTAPSTVDRLRGIAERIGKTAVVVNESPGGIVSRLLLLVRNEAIRLLAEGVASADDIDTAMKLGAGWPMGPLELSDLVGLDIHVNNSDILSEEMGDNRYRPHPLVRKIVRGGHLGRKTGRGFHEYGESP